MQRTDRLLGMLLRLRSGRVVTASVLAEQFEVSLRTVYRDMETLSALGVPVYAEQGRHGGYRLLDGYFLPAISFSRDEAISLVLGLTILGTLRSRPFASGLETASAKLLAAMPRHLAEQLAEADRILGVERSAIDAFHLERVEPPLPQASTADEQAAIDTFLLALLDRNSVELEYQSPYRSTSMSASIIPGGLFWDRDRWYLVGDRLEKPARRIWRADRVRAIRILERRRDSAPFDVRTLLGRTWLTEAMQQWVEQAPVRIRVTNAQAERLRGDWYYQHAHFEEHSDGSVVMTFGQDRHDIVVELIRWLGPGAHLLEPAKWRTILRDELQQMIAELDNA